METGCVARWESSRPSRRLSDVRPSGAACSWGSGGPIHFRPAVRPRGKTLASARRLRPRERRRSFRCL